MANKIILVAETGSDMPKELAQELGVILIPMHVSMGDKTLDDGTFPPEDVCAYYDRTGKIPTTSGSTIYDFESVYDRIFEENPNAQVLHLAYSAITTCSYHSSELAIENKSYKNNVRLVDTKHVSVGQCVVVSTVAQWLKDHPEASLDEATAAAEEIKSQIQMCFLPQNLNYLRAGGRCSNATALVGNLLQLHPCIEILDGKLIACKKYRGNINKCYVQYIKDRLSGRDDIDTKRIFITDSGLSEEVRAELEEVVRSCQPFEEVHHTQAGCTVSSHCGPDTIGVLYIHK